MSKCVCVWLCTYVEARGRYWVLTSISSLLYHSESRYLTELGAGSFSLASSQQSGDLPDSIPLSAWATGMCRSMLGLLMGAGIWTLVLMIALQVLWTDKPFLQPLRGLHYMTHQCKIWYLPSSASLSQTIVSSSNSIAVAAAIVSEPPEHARASELLPPPPLSLPLSLSVCPSISVCPPPLFLSLSLPPFLLPPISFSPFQNSDAPFMRFTGQLEGLVRTNLGWSLLHLFIHVPAAGWWNWMNSDLSWIVSQDETDFIRLHGWFWVWLAGIMSKPHISHYWAG